jgi:DNA adenine methylase
MAARRGRGGDAGGDDTAGGARFDITKLGSLLEAVHERLAGVWIECLPWEQFIKRWDRPTALFYLDPPYVGSEHYYGRGLFERADHARLAGVLKTLRGRFILTLNDCPEVRELYAWATLEPVRLPYTTSGAGSAAKEVIITCDRDGGTSRLLKKSERRKPTAMDAQTAMRSPPFLESIFY